MDALQTLWKTEKPRSQAGSPEMKNAEMLQIIQKHLKREKKAVGRYLIATWVWQMIIYSFLTHLIVRYWGDWFLVLSFVAGMLLYLPFTVKWSKYSSTHLKGVFAAMTSESTVKNRLTAERTHLEQFFRFKKMFDWIGIPALSFLIALIFSKLSIIPPLEQNAVPGIIIGLGWSLLSVMAVRNENRNSFEKPLRQLQTILDDIENAE